MDYDTSLRVWQTEDCVRCGGCYYVYKIKKKDGLKKRGNTHLWLVPTKS